MNVNDLVEIKKTLRKTTEDFILAAKNEYNISLDISRESLPLLEKIVDKVKYLSGSKREGFQIGLTAFLVELLLKCFKGETFINDIGIGVRLYNTSLGKNIEIFPGTWISKRLQNGQMDSIAFKFNVLSPKESKDIRFSSEWPEDKPLAANFARRLEVPPNDEHLINTIVRKLLNNPEKFSNLLSNNLERVLGKTKQNDKSYKYFLGRIYKINFFVAKLKFKHDFRKFGKVFESLSIKQIMFFPDEFTALLEYIKDVPFGVNDNIFDQLFEIEKTTQLFNTASSKLRDETIIYFLELNGRKIYHHNIKELKKILGFIKEDNKDAIDFLSTYQVEYRQGCYKAIEFIFSYEFKEKELFDNFICQKDTILWLDNASGKDPQKPWNDKLIALEKRGISQDLKIICEWMLAHDELRYDEKNNWLDSIFSHFQKSAKWFLHR